MHQFAVWRVSNGSLAAVPSTVAHRQSTFKCGRTPTPANAAVIARTVWAQFRRRSNLSQPGRASRPPIVAVPRRRPIWQWLRRPGRFLAEWRQSQCRGPDRAPRSGLQWQRRAFPADDRRGSPKAVTRNSRSGSAPRQVWAGVGRWFAQQRHGPRDDGITTRFVQNRTGPQHRRSPRPKQARRDGPLHRGHTPSGPRLIVSIATMIRGQVSARPGSMASPQLCTPKMMRTMRCTSSNRFASKSQVTSTCLWSFLAISKAKRVGVNRMSRSRKWPE